MSDSFEFTLHSPLTQEDWNKLSDAELENSPSVIFQTPQGRQVRYIKCEVLDKIRAEIDSHCSDNRDRNDGLYIAMRIIDRYKAEGSEE